MRVTSRWGQRILGVAALVLLAWSAYEGARQSRIAVGARTEPAPQGLLNLQLVPDEATAGRVVASWDCENSTEPGSPCAAAYNSLDADFRFILAYALAWSVTILWASWVCQTPKLRLFLIGSVVAAAIADVIENHLLGYQLGSHRALPLGGLLSALTPESVAAFARAHTVSTTRAMAMFKFVALSVGGLGAIALAGGAWVSRAAETRKFWLAVAKWLRRDCDEPARQDAPASAVADARKAEDPAAAAPPAPGSFAALVAEETKGLFPGGDVNKRPPDHPVSDGQIASGEPWVKFRAADIIGLAFSGGGIRSATFNLGLLEGLERLGLLRLFDYLSTVSGGGYVGSFWSAWLMRRAPASPLFPIEGGSERGYIDSTSERHLREFSRFLLPRLGVFQVETWTGVVAVLVGLLPALVLALSVIGVLLIGWLALTFPLASPTTFSPLPMLGAITAIVLIGLERRYLARKLAAVKDLQREFERLERIEAAVTIRYAVFAVGAVVIVLLAHAALVGPVTETHIYRLTDAAGVSTWQWQPRVIGRGYAHWWQLTGIGQPKDAWIVSPALFDYAIAWLLAAMAMVFLRLVPTVWPNLCRRSTLAAYDRVLYRLVVLAAVWIGGALVWHLAINIENLTRVTISAILSAGVFATLRNWMGVSLRRSPEPGVLDRLKPMIPPVLAYLTLLLAAGAVGNALIAIGGTDWLTWWALASGMGLVLVIGLFIDPAEFGLHAFYRDRISRAYSGAHNAPGPEPRYNRATEPQEHDDPRLADLITRPLHLVCCAANDLTGDALETLSRGARSAVLSKYGFSIGNCYTGPNDLTLGSAVTASAAAFNSNMGRISLELGPAVSFLMTALNLRLGLWLRHPKADPLKPRRWPGLLLYREMFGRTMASGVIEKPVPLLVRDVHLSDGGHFENLALYELIRRHCRYILVSDCGADPEVAFDDLGNALRRVREDFGVEVSLDVSPLRPGPDGRSRQHIALGTIHYSETDRGILLYVKPTLTGDESPDVLQYKTRNGAFPHEGTSDQFYDEAQWESYRRLGMHVAECVFEFVTPPEPGGDDARRLTADWVFGQAVHRWGETPAGLADRVLAMTERFNDLESHLRESAVSSLLHEVFPELPPQPAVLRLTEEEWEAQRGMSDEQRQALAKPADPNAVISTPDDLLIILRVTQAMEDVWIACELDRWWNHPLNMGWTNLFARWATAPSFRHWWPLFSPMYSPGFRAFIDQRFPGRSPVEPGRRFGVPQKGTVAALAADAADGLAAVWWKTRSTQPHGWSASGLSAAWTGRTLYQYLLPQPNPVGEPTQMEVGIVAVREQAGAVGWTSDDFFVPPSLWGTGIGWYFLRGLLIQCKVQTPANATARPGNCYVVVKAPTQNDRNQVSLEDRRSFIEQYRKMGFRQRVSDEREQDAIEAIAFARNHLGFSDEAQRLGDTLWQLTLAAWDPGAATDDPKDKTAPPESAKAPEATP